ncbi:MAG: Holliday junction resolvase RuvX [Phycisphaerales bacterium]|nr:Holliday junction resolvase RuvX [Phycisphaerales bacterium]
MPSSRIIGIDYGVRRIGVALGDQETGIATPLTTVEGCHNVSRDAAALAELAAAESAAAFVVGLPMNMDGSEGPQAALTRRFATELERLSELPVHFQDERLSSYAAGEVLSSTGLSRKKRRALNDPVAAQKILQAYLDGPG